MSASLRNIVVTVDDMGDEAMKCNVCDATIPWPTVTTVTVQLLVNAGYRHIETDHSA